MNGPYSEVQLREETSTGRHVTHDKVGDHRVVSDGVPRDLEPAHTTDVVPATAAGLLAFADEIVREVGGAT